MAKLDRITRLIKWKRWNKIGKMLEKGKSDTKIAIAAELGKINDEQPIEFLNALLLDPDDQVKLQAVKSLGNLGVERTKVNLQQLITIVPEENTELHTAIREALASINEANDLK